MATCTTWWPGSAADRTEYVPLPKFLNEALFGRRDLVLSYDRGGGLRFANADMQADFQRALDGLRRFPRHEVRAGPAAQPRRRSDSYRELPAPARAGRKEDRALDRLRRHHRAGRRRLRRMGSEDRNCLVILKRWAQNQSFLRADVTLCLVTENLTALNSGLVQNPGVAAIEIPLPDERERARVCSIATGGDAAAAGLRRHRRDCSPSSARV